MLNIMDQTKLDQWIILNYQACSKNFLGIFLFFNKRKVQIAKIIVI